MEFQWAPDGRAIFISSWLTSNTSEFWRVTVDPRTLQQVRSERLMTSSGEAEKLAVSPQGDRLAFGMASRFCRLWSFAFDASAGRVTSEGVPLTDTGAWAGTSDLTRDGDALVYDSMHLGTSRKDLWVLDVENGTRRSLTSDGHMREGVQWSRDGRRIAYVLFRAVEGAKRRFESMVMVRDRDGAEEPLTTPLPTNWDTHDFIAPFDWSPDGQAVLTSFDHPNRHFAIGLLPLAAAPHAEWAMTVLASDSRYNLWQGNYSPNGKWIAFVVGHRQQPGRSEVAVMPSSGADPDAWTIVTGSERWADKPRWSPDGRTLYFLQSSSGGGGMLFDVWSVRFDPDRGQPRGKPFQITHFDSSSQTISPGVGTGEISVSTTRLVLPMIEETGSIWMLDAVDR